jgi:hypothetical protein
LPSSVLDENKDLRTIGFDLPAKWYLLQEDRVIDALDHDDFPGQLLIKLGFGRADEAIHSTDEWIKAMDDAKRMTNYQVLSEPLEYHISFLNHRIYLCLYRFEYIYIRAETYQL